MTAFLILTGILFLPALPILLSPGSWVRAVAGWTLLGLGLLLIDEHVATPFPYDDDGVMFGPGSLSGAVWVAWIAAMAALLARWKAASRPPGGRPALPWARDWAIPVSLLLTAAGMHWLRNRLAGAEPAALVHFSLLGPAVLTCLIVAWCKKWRFGGWTAIQRFALALSASVALLVVWDIQAGFGLWSRAEELAAGRPRCMMTYGGFEHRREALSGWDLSPLVNRHYAQWAASKAPVVVVRESEGVGQYRWFNGRWRSEAGRGFPCVPRRTGRAE